GSALASSGQQLEQIGSARHIPPFGDRLKNCGLSPLMPTGIDIMQVNLGYMCNQTCTHCHIDAGPDRKEIMSREVMQACLDAIDISEIKTVDLTGGAPEMNPDFQWFVQQLREKGVEIIVRSNLTILVSNKRFQAYPAFFSKQELTIIASLPCYTRENTDRQRGDGVFSESIRALKMLNELGYGKSGSGLLLHLVYNPGGPSLPPAQQALETDYKESLIRDYGISFNNLYTITNLPVSRFLDHLLVNGHFETYMTLLSDAFNPAAAEGVMCRNTLSVRWDGALYDCDFNQILDIRLDGKAPADIRDFDAHALLNRKIALNQHCYGCTAGAGSSCQGSIV
ncbi:MAG: arsenosugar biosynthesis radical SAM (seleno)protein ArsS, partial [Flavobacteriales bacterium]